MKSLVLILVVIPALVSAKKCTNPTNSPNTPTQRPNTPTQQPDTPTQRPDTPTQQPDTTTPAPQPESTVPPTTTPSYPPPEDWPRGRFSLVKAGSSCPDFFRFRTGYRYQDSEDFRNGNVWPRDSQGFGKMKSDGYEMAYCSKNKNRGVGDWPSGNYCIHRYGSNCPRGFQVGNITWDDENTFNMNRRKGSLPSGIYNKDTTQFFCCRDDGSETAAIDLPVTKPFYLYRYKSECQKVRGMAATEEVVFFDDEDTNNVNAKGGAHPFDSGNPTNHKLHYCYYVAK